MTHAVSRTDAPHLLLTTDGFQAAVWPMLPTLRSYARRLTGTAPDGEDLVQDTLTRAWAARLSFAPGSNLKAWLLRIARNSFLSARRRLSRQVSWEREDIERALIAPASQEAAVHLRDVDDAVATLPEPQRRAFDAIIAEGLSYEQASTRLDVPLNTLKSRVARARAAVVQILDDPRSVERTTERPRADGPTLYDQWKRSGARLIGRPDR